MDKMKIKKIEGRVLKDNDHDTFTRDGRVLKDNDHDTFTRDD